ncbi:MAG: T9SS type A sorting domain-containing protein [Bacteroidales bacterium]|nr:T9SS type A sorting domain-containing protein [Bacteroidales bacterium]
MIHKPFLPIIILLGMFNITFGQSGPLVWKFANTGDYANLKFMQTDALGNTYLAGTFGTEKFAYEGVASVPGTTGGETLNTFILKLDQTGRPIWLRSIQGDISGSTIQPVKISISPGGEVGLIVNVQDASAVLIGETSITVSDSTQTVPLLVKFTKGGKLAWAHPVLCISGSQPAVANDLFVDDQGDTYATGFFRGTSATLGGREIDGLGTDAMLFVACIRADGSIGWFNNVPTDLGDNGDLIGTNIANTSGNFFYVAGTHQGYKGFVLGTDTLTNTYRTDVFLSRFNKSGQAEWAVKFNGDSLDFPEEIRVLPNNNAVLLGLYNSTYFFIDGEMYSNYTGNYHLFLASYDENGNYVNSRTVTTNLAFYNFSGKNAYLHTDSYGNIYVSSEFEGSEVFTADSPIPNAEIGTSDVFAAKINSTTFSPYWVFHCSAPGNNYLDAVSVNSKGEVFLGGTSFSELSLNGEILPVELTLGVPYLAKIKTDGTPDFIYAQVNNSENQVSVQGISSDSYGNTFIAGKFFGALSNLDAIDLTNLGENGIFLAKYAHTQLIHGEVNNSAGEPVTSGYAKIYGYTLYQRAPVNDSVRLTGSGTFEFKDIPYGKYIVTAVPEGEIADLYLPTYFPASEYWEFAEEVIVNEKTPEIFLEISMQERSDFMGETRLTGSVFEEEINQSLNKSYSKARPTRKSKVIVAGNKAQQKSTYQIIGYTETDDEGNFSFSDIEDGSYYVWVDIPGLPCDPVYFLSIIGGTWVSNLDYLVTEEVVEGTGIPFYDIVEANSTDPDIRVFPNPATDLLTIELAGISKAIVDIYDYSGISRKHAVLTVSSTQLDLSALSGGNYIIRIMTEQQIIFRKFTLSR